MRYRALALLLAAGFVGVGAADKASKGVPADVPIHKGLEVHEWGVFTIHDDLELANADMRSEWEAMPKFFYGQTAGREVPKEYRLRLIKKPVIFFHAQERLALEVRVDFPGGFPAVWWPRTTSPLHEEDGCPGEPKRTEPYRFLEWKVLLKEPAKGESTDVKPRPAPAGDWVETLRAVKADDVFVRGPAGLREFRDGRAVAGPAYEREKFVYYDGLIPVPKTVALLVEKDKVSIVNRASHPVFDVTVVDRRLAAHTYVGGLAKLDAKSKPQELELKEVDAKDWPGAAISAQIRELKDAGLFEDEAKSLAEVWKKDFFQADGLTMIYRLPQEEYERLLPMKLNPRAEKLVRIGLVHQPHCEPDLAARVAKIAGDLDSTDFDAREQAQKRLEEMGRVVFAQLKRLRKEAKSPEAQRRLDELLERYDARKAITP